MSLTGDVAIWWYKQARKSYPWRKQSTYAPLYVYPSAGQTLKINKQDTHTSCIRVYEL